MTTTRHSLLDDPLLTLDLPDASRTQLTLPAVLARLARGEAGEFAFVQAHQLQPWEALLIQLGALATHATGAVPEGEPAWREALLTLTRGAVEPWCLVVDDREKPAFLQPPVGGDDFTGKGERTSSADAIDLLVTSKNHDVKQARAARSTPEHWVFALVSLQTMEGFGGAFNYGIARMNGGYGSRPSVGLAASAQLASRFRRDLARWNLERDRIIERFGYKPEGGIALVWCEPWDGTSALPLDALDPCFIEVCRRLRLVSDGDAIVMTRSTSKSPRIDAKALKGDTGDLWTPIKAGDERMAFTAPPTGLTYKVLHEILFGDEYSAPEALKLGADDQGEMVAIVRVLARGQGKTAGLHERVLPLPGKVRKSFAPGGDRKSIGTLSARRIEQVADVQRKVLHPALCALLQAAPDKLDFTDDRTQRWRQAHSARIDDLFFAELFRDMEVDANEADRRWLKRCIDIARAIFRDALEAVPLPSVRAYKARAGAERVFEGSARKNFPIAYTEAPTVTAQETP
jgi:CRISPR system Cascade subunit CasA